MIRAYLSEWIKIKRPFFLLGWVGSIILFTILAPTMMFTSVGGESDNPHGPPGMTIGIEQLAESGGWVSGVGVASTFIGIIALAFFAVAVSREFSTGTVRHLLVVEPRRYLLLSGKLLSLSTFIVIVVAIATIVTMGMSMALAPTQDISTDAWLTSSGFIEALVTFVNTAISAVVWGLIGATLAMITRSAAASIAIGVGFFMIFETILGQFAETISPYFPGSVLGSFAFGGTLDLSYSTAVILVTLYALACVTTTFLIFAKRDVTD
jgi:ABC-type transport system involved in multi-copper enzyme maturation permease subunit